VRGLKARVAKLVRKAAAPTEAQFQSQVIQYARLCGWRVAHFRAARTKTGWRTPVAADGGGFVDLICIRGPRLLAVELKSAAGRLSAAQRAWCSAMADAGAEVYVWRPADWAEVVRVLGA
jgi:hypothetical protein